MRIDDIERRNDLNTWSMLKNVESIELTNKRMIFPNIINNRFYFTKWFMYIQHGCIEPYGIFFNNFSVSRNGFCINVQKDFVTTKYYNNFRKPQVGDILIFKTKNNIYEFEITEAKEYNSGYVLYVDKVFNPFDFIKNCRCGFYDPRKRTENSMHLYEGNCFMNFVEKSVKNSKKIQYSERIPIWKIKSIKYKKG